MTQPHSVAAPASYSWSVDDVLAVQHCVMRSLANYPYPNRVTRRRLASADHLLPRLYDPGLVGLGNAAPGPLVALCSFLVANQSDPDDWEWCRDVMREAQISVPEMLAAIHPLAHLYTFSHDVPVQIFQEDPAYYALVPLAELPYGHSMHNCGHKVTFEKELRHAQVRNLPRRLLGRGSAAATLETEAGRRLTSAVAKGTVTPCHLHLAIDWETLNAHAEEIRTTVRPWTRDNVKSAATATEGLSDRERIILQNLFLDPIRWNRGSSRVTGGQHRLCGNRAAQATHAFIAIGADPGYTA